MKNIKNIVSVLLLAILMLNCGGREEETSPKPKPTDPTPVTPTVPKKDSAILNILASGRTDYSNISVDVYNGSGSQLITSKKLSKEGKTQLDMSEQIGKTIVLKSSEIADGQTVQHPNSLPVAIGKNEVKTVTITIPEAKKDYNTEISVTKDGKVASGIKVYALNFTTFNLFRATVAVTGSETLKNQLSATTNSQGVARFNRLTVNDLNKKYYFVVVTQEPNVMAGKKGEFLSTEIEMNNTLEKGKIEIKSTSLTVNLTASANNTANTKIHLYKYKPVSSAIAPVYTASVNGNKVIFNDIAEGKYYLKASTEGSCFYSDVKEITVVKDEQNTTSLEMKSGSVLELNNSSPNPYTVVVKDGAAKEQSFIMNGRTTKTITINPGKTNIKVEQNSGYLFSPTKENYSVDVECEIQKKVCFPSDRCN